MTDESDDAKNVPPAVDLSRLRKRRSANRNVVRAWIVKAKDLMSKGHDDKNMNKVKAQLQAIIAKEKQIRVTDDEIQENIDDDKLIEDIEEASEFDVEVRLEKIEIEAFLNKDKSFAAKSEMSKFETPGVKLPKLTVKTFKGEPTEWQQFEEMFKAAVDSNSSISNVEKFSYLKGFLAGEAEKCIEGIPLSDDNYTKAFSLLQERYGNKQLIIMSHVKKLLRLEKVGTGRNTNDLRNLYDQVEIHVRSLSSLNVKSEQYGPMLIPIILERLPDDIKLEISRKLGNDSWCIDEFMKKLKLEISARESCNFMKPVLEREEWKRGRQTTETLMTGAHVLVCAFYLKNHYHDKCTVVTDPEERKDIVKKKRLCYRCMSKSHNIKFCKSKKNCYHCHSASHHSAICLKSSKKDDKVLKNGDVEGEHVKQSNNLVGSRTAVLLQTASGIVSDNLAKRSATVKIVLDSGA